MLFGYSLKKEEKWINCETLKHRADGFMLLLLRTWCHSRHSLLPSHLQTQDFWEVTRFIEQRAKFYVMFQKGGKVTALTWMTLTGDELSHSHWSKLQFMMWWVVIFDIYFVSCSPHVNVVSNFGCSTLRSLLGSNLTPKPWLYFQPENSVQWSSASFLRTCTVCCCDLP